MRFGRDGSRNLAETINKGLEELFKDGITVCQSLSDNGELEVFVLAYRILPDFRKQLITLYLFYSSYP